MSIEVIYRVMCNGEGCNATGPEMSTKRVSLGASAGSALVTAAKYGWEHVSEGGGWADYCPECVAKRQEAADVRG